MISSIEISGISDKRIRWRKRTWDHRIGVSVELWSGEGGFVMGILQRGFCIVVWLGLAFQ